jgi:hypothetical protein
MKLPVAAMQCKASKKYEKKSSATEPDGLVSPEKMAGE